uniref:Putative ovule protein n=1 Tax=Solanum chacoense TaxID=4108 RepID=A0A0V0GUP7_SOLCH
MKMCHIMSNHLLPIILRPTSASPRPHHIQPLTPPHRGICTSPSLPNLNLSTTEATLTLSRISSFLILSVLVPTHPFQHPHFRHLHLSFF